jgi:antitoxin VapB
VLDMNKPFKLDAEAERRLQELAEATGKPADDIIRDALEAWAAKVRPPIRPKRTPAEKGAAIDEIIARFKKLPVLDPRSADEIVGYDEIGVPR